LKLLSEAPTAPTADQVLDKYIQAIGGTQRLGGLTSFAAKIDEPTVNIIQGTGAGGIRFKLYFDVESGLLTRQRKPAPKPSALAN
jgi:hypothetical protein